MDKVFNPFSENLDYTGDMSGYEPLLPVAPDNPETHYLNANREWKTISIGAGGFAGNLYFTTENSDVVGYKKISYVLEDTESIMTSTITNEEVLARVYLFDNPIETTVIDAGVWVVNYRVKVSGSQGVTQLKFEAFVRHTDSTETTLFSDYSPELNNTEFATIRSESNQPVHEVLATDRLGVRIYVKTTANNAITISTVLGDGDGSYFTTPLRIRHNQLRNLNEDPNYQHITTLEKAQIAGYVHTQNTSSAQWTVVHNLAKYPNVSVVDSANTQVEGEVEYIDNNTVKLTFTGAFTGKAYLN